LPAAFAKLIISILASGGIGNGREMTAACALGAEGVNIGTRLVVTQEAPVHENMKPAIMEADERQTMLMFPLGTSKLEAHLEQLNSTLEAHERISHILICKSPWTIENDLLTHTLKMLRDDIENFYKPQIEAMLSSREGPIIIET
jgi:long-subunit acyl-CoA synthetase (AMP-forming)